MEPAELIRGAGDRQAAMSPVIAAWNAAIYAAQIEDDRLREAMTDNRYIEATREVLREHGGPWFQDESFVIRRKS